MNSSTFARRRFSRATPLYRPGHKRQRHIAISEQPLKQEGR